MTTATTATTSEAAAEADARLFARTLCAALDEAGWHPRPLPYRRRCPLTHAECWPATARSAHVKLPGVPGLSLAHSAKADARGAALDVAAQVAARRRLALEEMTRSREGEGRASL